MSLLRNYVVPLLLLCCTYSFAQEGFMIGIAPTVAPTNSLIGGNARLYYGTDPRFCFGPEISSFPYQKTADQFEERLFEANLNAHYLFELAHRFELYPLTGINYTVETGRSTVDPEDEEEHTATGINYGAGLHYSFGRVLVFGEFKSVIGELSDEFFTFGTVILPKKPGAASHHKK